MTFGAFRKYLIKMIDVMLEVCNVLMMAEQIEAFFLRI